jgi:asparagine synthase (glutamine-hydrolysing)
VCGIAGALELDGRPSDPDVLARMTAAIAHRGPDGEGVYIDGSLGLGHRRLAIIDPTPQGDQPLRDSSGTNWITFNGEIYNFKELRAELESRGHRFRTNTDTEVVLAAYAEWDLAAVDRLRGMFAFALWDTKRHRLWIVRDRLGIKPLFIAQTATTLAFGSEIKAVLEHPSVDRKLDETALAYYLALNWTPAPRTLFGDVRQVLPGHYVVADSNGVRDVEYWKLTYEEGQTGTEREWVEGFTAALDDAVRSHLVSDVPFGAFLSGGLDSSSVAYFMAQNMAEPPRTFSIGFPDASFDETPFARQVAESVGTEHSEEIVGPDAVSLLESLVWHSEEPTADSSMIPVHILAGRARKDVKMVLTGDGGDEILAGYPTYIAHYIARAYRGVPSPLRRAVSSLVGALPDAETKMNARSLAKRFVAGAEHPADEAHGLWRVIFDADERRKLLAPVWDRPGARSDVTDLYREHLSHAPARNPLNRLLWTDTTLYLPNDMLVKVDRMTMAHGLEARVPFLDHQLVEYAARIPPSLKLHRLTKTKYILRQAMRGRLPASVVDRKKAGFNVPVAGWLRRELREFTLDTLSAGDVAATGMIDPGAARAVVDDHLSGRRDRSHEIWCLLVLVMWSQRFGVTA